MRGANIVAMYSFWCNNFIFFLVKISMYNVKCIKFVINKFYLFFKKTMSFLYFKPFFHIIFIFFARVIFKLKKNACMSVGQARSLAQISPACPLRVQARAGGKAWPMHWSLFKAGPYGQVTMGCVCFWFLGQSCSQSLRCDACCSGWKLFIQSLPIFLCRFRHLTWWLGLGLLMWIG